MENAGAMGFSLNNEDLYEPLKTRSVIVNKPINSLVQFAIDNGTNYKTIKLLNPWLTSKSLFASPGKTYIILVPVTSG